MISFVLTRGGVFYFVPNFFFFLNVFGPQSGGGEGRPRETDASFSASGARRAGHGARVRARLRVRAFP